jgi:competence protein ComEA
MIHAAEDFKVKVGSFTFCFMNIIINCKEQTMKLISQYLLFICICLTPLLSHAESPDAPPNTQIFSPININTADAQTISDTLSGIGLKKAQAIIEYREAYGPFHNIDELASVKGIGQGTLAKNFARITLK